MTSKESPKPSRMAVLEHSERTERHALIKSGLLPSLEELFEGTPFYADSIDRDIQAWCDAAQEHAGFQMRDGEIVPAPMPAHLLSAIAALRDTCSPIALEAVRLQLEALGRDDQHRMRAYQACKGVEGARQALAVHIAADDRQSFVGLWREATTAGLLFMPQATMYAYCAAGLRLLRNNWKLHNDYDLACIAAVEAEAAAKDAATQRQVAGLIAAVKPLNPDDPELRAAIDEDRAEFLAGDDEPAGLIVVPSLPDGTGARKDTIKSWGDKIARPLPLVPRGDVAAHRQALARQWPHAVELIDVVLGDLAARDTVRFRPTLFVGPAGSGKSSLARAICEHFELPCELQPLAGVHDAAMMGTSAQWSSTRESVPLQLIKRTGMASVGMIWDEVEKIGTRRENGNVLDALLPMLEIDQARRYRDQALEVEVDLSMVSHFATANSIDGIPAPLRDRFRILTMPEPGWQHLGTLTRQIVDRVARERGIDGRWFAPLAEDEMDLVRAAWPGGSIRKLSRIVTTIVDGREQIMGRC